MKRFIIDTFVTKTKLKLYNDHRFNNATAAYLGVTLRKIKTIWNEFPVFFLLPTFSLPSVIIYILLSIFSVRVVFISIYAFICALLCVLQLQFYDHISHIRLMLL